MDAPFILIDDGDIALFQSISSLESYVESPDIESYQLFDSKGSLLSFVVEQNKTDQATLRIVSLLPVKIDTKNVGVNAIEELEEHIRRFLLNVTGRSNREKTLPDLIELLKNTIGFTF